MSKQNIQSRLLLANASLHAQRAKQPSDQNQTTLNRQQSAASTNSAIRPPSNTKSSKRHSISSDEYHYQATKAGNIKLENTYSLGPSQAQKFNAARIEEAASQALAYSLSDFKYEPTRCKRVIKEVTEEIKRCVKPLIYSRYKLVVSVAIGERCANESLIMGSRSLWNPETDNECTVNYKNESIFAVATIYAVYFD